MEPSSQAYNFGVDVRVSSCRSQWEVIARALLIFTNVFNISPDRMTYDLWLVTAFRIGPVSQISLDFFRVNILFS